MGGRQDGTQSVSLKGAERIEKIVTVERKKEMTKVIYETRGKAQEYCPLAANLYKGCSHGCFYCYVPSIFRASPEEFKKGQARPGVLEALRKEAPLYKNKSVLFCFTCDP